MGPGLTGFQPKNLFQKHLHKPVPAHLICMPGTRCQSGFLLTDQLLWMIWPETMCVAVRYVHRVGRTARMGKVGEALLFLMPSEKAYLARLEARGVHPRPLNVLPALDLLPADTTQQVGLSCRGAGQSQLPHSSQCVREAFTS